MLGRQFICVVFAAALASAGFSPLSLAANQSTADQPAAKRYRVVIQVSDGEPASWGVALNNVRNIQNRVGEKNADIEIVAYGPGIDMLKSNSPVGGRIDETMATGVRVVACENTMQGRKLTRKNMLPRIGYVPAGVVELIVKQQEGWAYIRP
jgi:hypothetical protein